MPNKVSNQAEAIFHAALELKKEDRAAYLTEACLGDQFLYSEVTSLVSALESSGGFLDESILDDGMKLLGSSSGESMVGKSIGTYKITAALGTGGMGEVYLAEDSRLGRKVALKFLSREFVGDNWAKRQLIKEAQAVAMLDHPNICPVYGYEEDDDYDFIVMQYVEGETLAQLIRNQSLQLDRIVRLAQQIIGAIAEAHAHGIIHRDIKPKNIMVTPSGQVKVLDFGLAKTIQPKPSFDDTADSVSHLSQKGLIPGTVAYMSPEQLRAERLDYRSDIFSLGTVLYEMLCGKNPNSHGTNAEVISAILTSKPTSLRSNGSQIPRELDRMVLTCLKKVRNERFQSASELLIEWENYTKSLNVSTRKFRYLSVRNAAVAALIVLLVAVTSFIYRNATRPKTVAVMPIANETGDASLDYLGAGLSKSIVQRLSGLSNLRVKPFTMVSGYTGKIDAQKIARELHVDEVVVGRITGTKDALRLRVAMIDPADGSADWNKTYPLEIDSVFQVQDDVSKEVMSRLEFWSGNDKQKLARAHRPPQQAYDEYLRGIDAWSKRGKDNIKEAIAHFEEATRLDPSYPEAFADRANCYVLLNVVSYGTMGTHEAMSKARWAANRALDIDPYSAEAHSALGVVLLRGDWDWQNAAREFERAIELKPDYAPAHLWYSDLLAITGNLQKSRIESERAKDLDPFSPAASLHNCRSFYFDHQYDEVLRCLDKLKTDYPDYHKDKYLRGYTEMQKHMYPEAIKRFQDIYAEDKALGGASLGYLYGISDRKTEALKVLSEMMALADELHAKGQELPPQEIGMIYLGIGEMDKALEWLGKSADEKYWPFTSLAVDPLYEGKRLDPRFIQLIERLHLPQHPL